MKYQTSSEFSATEKQFLEALRQHPELRARFQSILDLIRQADGTVQTADAVEGQLIEVLRQLGHASMNQWAAQAEQRVSTELRQQDATVRSRKKKR
jgi:inosine/xanthosine triphosphate pyrophosphatase family protein